VKCPLGDLCALSALVYNGAAFAQLEDLRPMRSPRLVAGLLATLVAFSACKNDPAPPVDGDGTPPTLTESPLAETTVGVSYSATLGASGGTAPYTFSAQGLPPGLTLASSTGALSGTPTAAGDFQVQVTVKGANGKDVSRTFPLKVYPAVAFKAATLPAATVQTAYTARIEAEGGKPPLALKLAAGDLPPGITFNASSGQLSGTAPGSTGNAGLTFEATDVHGAKSTVNLTLTVAEALRVANASLAPATEGVEYRVSDSVTERLQAFFGVGALSFAATGLPQGLSINPTTGELGGAPAVGTAGTHNLTFTVGDAGGRNVNHALTLQVVKPQPSTFGGVRGVAPTGGRITQTLTVFTTNGTRPLSGVGVRVRKNGQEYNPVKEALTDAEGKAVFTGLGLNGNSDTVDVTANGKELINTTLANVNASVVTLRMLSRPEYTPRVSASGAYEPTSRRFVLTSGQDSTNASSLFYTSCRNDTMEAVDVAQKSFRTLVPGGLTTSPSPRYDAAMAAAGGVAVLFGGRNCLDTGDGLGDTWEFDLATNTWTLPQVAFQPLPRRAASMVREPSGDTVLMVGGFRNPSYMSDVWRYAPANNTWTLLSAAPFSRAFMGSAANTNTGELWFCGGRSPSTVADCNAYNVASKSWSAKPALPTARSELAMAFDPNSGNMYAFGGRAADSTPFSDLLVLRAGAATWESVIPPGAAPAPRYAHVMYFDLTRNELVLTLGLTRDPLTLRTSRLSDVWTYNGTAWTERGTPAPTAPSHTLSGQLSGGPANGGADLVLSTVSGGGTSTAVTFDAQGRASYTLTNIPPGEAAFLTVMGFENNLPFPNNLWTYTDMELTPLGANRTLDITLPPGPAVLVQAMGQVLLPASFRGQTSTALASAELEAGPFPFQRNGLSDEQNLPREYKVAFVASSAPRRQRIDLYMASELACEDYGTFTPIGSGTQNLTMSGNVTGLSPGQLECRPAGPSGVGQARARFAASSVERLAVGDLDGDTFPDLVIPRHLTSGVGLVWGTPSVINAFPDDDCCDIDRGHSVAVGDFNKDGKLDLAVTEPNANQVKIKLGSTTTPRTFGAATAFPAGNGAASIATADVSSDGNLDLLVANPASNTVSLLLGAGNGTFSAPQPLTLAGTAPKAVLVANADGDGFADLVVVVAEGISLALDGFDQGPFANPTLLTAGLQPSSVVVGRLNADTLPDLVVTNEGSNTLSLFMGAGSGSFASQVNLPTSTTPTGVVLAELTGDSHLDLAVTSGVEGTVALYRGASNGTFAQHAHVSVNGVLKSLAPVDFNGDGLTDLAVASTTTNSVYLLPGQRQVPTSAGDRFSFTAPAGAGYFTSLHGINGAHRYWDYHSPIQPGLVSYSLPLPSTLAPSSAPVAPAIGQLMLNWTPWVRKWDPSRPFNPRQFFIANLTPDSDTQPGASSYLSP
jgi:hypothetical protein